VVADDGADTVDGEVLHCEWKRSVELPQLVVYLDTECLEHTPCRVSLAAGRVRHRRGHDVREFPG
jgi:hypothetical protein